MSGALLPAERDRILKDQALDAAQGAWDAANKRGDRGAIAIAKDDAARAAVSYVQAKAKADAAQPLPANLRPPADMTELARAGFEGQPDLLGIAKRNNIPAGILRAAADDAKRLEDRASRGHDAKAEAMRVINGALGANAAKLLAGAKAMASRDPALRAYLDATGAGNSPWMVRHLGEEALRRGISR